MTSGAVRNDSTFNLSFLTGVVAGSAIAAGLVLWLRPRLREQVTQSLQDAGETAAAAAQSVVNTAADVIERVADVADEVSARAEEVRNEVASAVEHGAHAVSHSAREVERFAKASKTVHAKEI